jgi:hypothetical protein
VCAIIKTCHSIVIAPVRSSVRVCSRCLHRVVWSCTSRLLPTPLHLVRTATSFSFYHFHHVPTLSAVAVIITFATNCQTRLKGLLDSRMMWSSAPSSCIKTTHRWCYIDGIPVYFTCAVWRGDCDYDTQAALGLRQVVSHMIDLSKAKSTATIFGQSEYVAPSYRTGLRQNLATELTSTCINRS